jgi:putative transposase
MRGGIDKWRNDYVDVRTRRTLGQVLPAIFAALCRQRADSTAQPSASTTMQSLGL